MAPNRTCSYNGTTLWPTEVEELASRVGTILTADDGTRHPVERGTKRGFVLSWESPYPAIFDAVRALYALGGTPRSFTDPYGATYNALIPPDGITQGWRHSSAGTTTGTVYVLELTILEA